MRLRRLRARMRTVSFPMAHDLKRHKAKIIALIIIVSLIISLLLVYKRIQPTIVKMSEAIVNSHVTNIVNSSVSEIITGDGLDYEDLVTLQKDQNGNITALITNMSRINLLQTEISNKILAALANEDVVTIHVPLGSLIGGSFFIGRGPKIPVKIIALTSVNSAFSNEFAQAGINQTRHKIMLDIEVVLDMLIPGYSSTVTINLQVSIAETVVVGSVPNAYAGFN